MSHMKQFEYLKIQLQAIKLATKNFADEHCIGRGGFGKVYKGEIVHSQGQTMVALKRLDRAFGQGDPEFFTEIITLSLYKHENIISLLGYCDDCDEKILVYEYAPRRSLDLYLTNSELIWVTRLKICIGAARGLAHLHSALGTQQRVLHRDIKSYNILLDENWNAKISDFGLSKFAPANQQVTFLISTAVGTLGYVDPLYVEMGLLTKESDVYSFGVVLFEVLCGRLCLDNKGEHRLLVKLVQESYEQNTISEIICSNIKDEISPLSLKVFTEIAYMCLKRNREERPLMTKIVKALEFALQFQEPINDQVEKMHLRPETPDVRDMEQPVEIVNIPKAKEVQLVGILNVKVLRAMKLKRALRVIGRCTYVQLRLTNDDKVPSKKTNVIDFNSNPEWFEDFVLFVKDVDVQALEIVVRDEDGDKRWMNMVSLKDLIPEERKIITLDLRINMDPDDTRNDKSYGQIMVEMMYQPLQHDQILTDIEDENTSPTGGGFLVVRIHEGDDLDGIFLCVRVTVQNDTRITKVAEKFHDPVWKEEFTFKFEKPPTNESLHLQVVDIFLGVLKKIPLGHVDISLADVVKKKQTKEMYKLQNSENKGQLRVELQWVNY